MIIANWLNYKAQYNMYNLAVDKSNNIVNE